MAGSVNKVILVGNLGRDPEVRSMQSGGRLANFSIATSESWSDKQSGERKERTQWHRIVIYNDRLVDVAEKYLRKGMKVYIEGALESRQFTDKAGAERETTEVVLRQFRGELQMLDRGGEGGGSGAAAKGAASRRHDLAAAAAARPGKRPRTPAAIWTTKSRSDALCGRDSTVVLPSHASVTCFTFRLTDSALG